MKRASMGMAAGTLVLGTVAAASWGGWAVVTVDQVPEYLVVGRPTELTFAVRQHAVTSLTDLSPTVVAQSGRREITVPASRVLGGRYRASLVPPSGGDWQITIQSGFGRSKGMLLPVRAIDSTAPKPAPLAAVDRGRLLFAAKGCVTCHVHGGVDLKGELSGSGPDLTAKRFAAAYLEQFLRDPSIKPPNENGAQMPRPDLRTADIAPLIAFINAERQTARR